MKTIFLALFLPLAGCGMSDNLIAAVAVGANVGSVATIQRTPADAVYSWWTGRDCSIVRLDQGKRYCRAEEPKPETPAYCTRSLGAVNCWQDPATVPGHPRGVADGPTVLTVGQEADRVRSWP
ncbi:MAG TPA: hypothetical protein DDZ81_13825 [Acetobacteraceae bacterium]|jgi:hypothetical protein|nr:hypothetical protein [Acetobacteraceae bacterium]